MRLASRRNLCGRTQEVPISQDNFDSPWKDILEHHLEDFFAFFFTNVHAGVDWSQAPESLDKELLQLFPDSQITSRLADKLVRVRTRDGEPLEVMINIEVQAQRDEDIAQRTFTYNYRTYDRFQRPVVSVVVLCDESPRFHPKSFTACDLWGCRLRLEFPTAKLLEYNSRWPELEVSSNPFAIVTMAHLKTQATRKDPSGRLRWKLQLIRALYEKGFDRDRVVQLFKFIDWIMRLPEELNQNVRQAVYTIESEKKVQYVSSIERMAIEQGMQKGMQKGIQQGMQKGIQQGMQKGIQQGEARFLKRQLRRVFGDLAPDIEQRIDSASSEDIERWGDRILTCKTLAEIFD